MNKQAQDKLVASTLLFVEVGSATVKRAMDEVAIHEQAQKAASDLRPSLLEHMVTSGVVQPGQKQAADAMLGSHATTMQLLKSAVDKIVELRGEMAGQTAKQASNLGGPDTPQKTAGVNKPGSEGYNSLEDNFVGRPTNEKKASDLAFLKGAE